MRVLDLYAGLGGWSQPFRQDGHTVTTVDLDPVFGTDIVADISELTPEDLPGPFDVVLASPPCQTFSVMSIGTHWAGGWRAYEPKTERAREAVELVRKTVKLIDALAPEVSIVENPRGVLRKLDTGLGEPTTIWACHYGAPWAKP